MSTMSDTVRSVSPDVVTPLKEKLVRRAKKVALFIPAAIIFGLIILYYVQLSHMVPTP